MMVMLGAVEAANDGEDCDALGGCWQQRLPMMTLWATAERRME